MRCGSGGRIRWVNNGCCCGLIKGPAAAVFENGEHVKCDRG